MVNVRFVVGMKMKSYRKDSILVANKNETLHVFVELIQIITSWKYWIEFIINLTSVNRDDDEEEQ